MLLVTYFVPGAVLVGPDGKKYRHTLQQRKESESVLKCGWQNRSRTTKDLYNCRSTPEYDIFLYDVSIYISVLHLAACSERTRLTRQLRVPVPVESFTLDPCNFTYKKRRDK